MSESGGGSWTIDLTGQVALVTGASRGIGKAIACTLAHAGAWVACVARNRERLEATLGAIGSAGGKGDAFAADVTDGQAVESVVEQVLGHSERIDILVNNAGITRDGLLLRMEDDEWRQVIDTNLTGTFLFSRAVSRSMIQRRYGRIINITSVAGLTGNAGQCNYAASKAGVIGFTRSLAKELARRGVTANAVAPGFITTDMTDALPEATRDEVRKHIPMRRFGEPQEVADLVAYLASPQSGYLTGQVVTIDGGMT
jgi:3-oxoacyl-[acyl-carrier protein] reductase